MVGKGKIENLDPVKKGEEKARIRGRNGGIKSGESKRAKRLMTSIYKEYLKSKYGDDFHNHMSKVLKRGDSSTVAMMREIREATECADLSQDGIIIRITRKNIDIEPGNND